MVILPFKDQRSADFIRKQLKDLGSNIGNPIQTVVTIGSPSSIYEQLFICWPLHCYVTRAICIFIRICMGKMTIVSVTYENEAISIKIVLPYFSWAFFFLLCGLWTDLRKFKKIQDFCSRDIEFCHLAAACKARETIVVKYELVL